MNDKTLSWVLLLTLSVVWGSSFILMKLGLNAFTPVQMAALRLSIAALVLSPFLLIRFRGISWQKGLLILVIGFSGNAFPAFLFAKAETVIDSSVAGVLNSLAPIFVLGIAWLFFKQRFPLSSILGVLIGIAGAIVLLLGPANSGQVDAAGIDISQNLKYSLLVVIAMLNYAVSANLIKAYFSQFNPIMLTTLALCSMGFPALVYLLAGSGFIEVMQTHPQAWESLGYIAILGAVGTAFAVILFNRMLQISSLAFVSSVTYTIPVVAVAWGLMAGEPFSWIQGFGFTIIVSGVYLVNKK